MRSPHVASIIPVTCAVLLQLGCAARQLAAPLPDAPERPVALPPANCPYLDSHAEMVPDLAEVWPGCHIRAPILSLAGRCPDARPCMTPCESERSEHGLVVLRSKYAYDEQGRIISMSQRSTDGTIAETTRFTYPSSHTWTSTTESEQQTSNALAVLDDQGHQDSRSYRSIGSSLDERVSPVAREWSLHFVFDGPRLVQTIRSEKDRTTATTECRYDEHGRLLSCPPFEYVYDGPAAVPSAVKDHDYLRSFRWDDGSRLIGETGELGEFTYSYDTRGRLVVERDGSEASNVTIWRYVCQQK